MNENLLRMKEDVKFLVMDFETEDLNLYTTKPWQFACVIAQNGKVIREHNLLIKWPNLNISKEAEQITRFNRGIWESEGMDPKEAFELINEELDAADWIAGHNLLGFDVPVYRRSCERLGIKPLPIHRKLIDTLACGKGIKLERFYKPTENFFCYQMGMINERVDKKGFATLNAFCDYYSIPVDKSKLHDALYDVEKNYEVLKKMLWKIEI